MWKTRPDLALLDLYNVLYRPHIAVSNSPHSETFQATLTAPIVGLKDGIKTQFFYRKDNKMIWQKENEFKEISLKQMEALNADWTLLPSRTGWRVSFTYGALRKVLGLKAYEKIEFKIEVAVYPLGKDETVLTGYQTKFSLPVNYFKGKKDEKTGTYPFTHKPGKLTSLNIIKYAEPNNIYSAHPIYGI